MHLFIFSLSSSAAFRLFSERLRGGSGFCWTFYCDCVSFGFVWLILFFSHSLFGFSYAGFNLSVCFFSPPLYQTYHCLNLEKMSRHLTLTQLQIKQNNITVMHFCFCFCFNFHIWLYTLRCNHFKS